MTEMRRAAMRKAIKLDAPVEKIAATVAGLPASIEGVDRAIADERALPLPELGRGTARAPLAC